MKTTRSDYADGSGLAKIQSDEPVFLLRAQDKFAAAAVRYYAQLVEAERGDVRVIASARHCAGLMAAWPVKKSPDFPGERPIEFVVSINSGPVVAGAEKATAAIEELRDALDGMFSVSTETAAAPPLASDLSDEPPATKRHKGKG